MIKMIRKANFLKNKIKLFMSGGYRIKLDKNNYILFKKEEDYEIYFILKEYFLIYLKVYYLMMNINQSEFFFV